MATVQALWLLIVIGFDFSQRRVPNWLVLAGAALGLTALALGQHPQGLTWTDALGAGALGFGVMLAFHALGVMGAGDVKFAGALGLWVGLHGLLPVWIISSVLAAAHGLLWFALQRWPVAPWLVAVMSDPRAGAPAKPSADSAAPEAPAESIASIAPRQSRPHRRHVPYAAYLAVAALVWTALGYPPL